MEALIFLDSSGIINVPVYMQQKMEEIKNSPIKIGWQYSDVIRHGLNYKELNISKEQIIWKFNQALNKKD